MGHAYFGLLSIHTSAPTVHPRPTPASRTLRRASGVRVRDTKSRWQVLRGIILCVGRSGKPSPQDCSESLVSLVRLSIPQC